MSDTDDTDVLLLIPPNYFITATPEELEEFRAHHTANRIAAVAVNVNSNYENCLNKQIMDASVENSHNNMEDGTPTAHNDLLIALTPNKSAELREINNRLKLFESERERHNFIAASDISTISNNTQAERLKRGEEGLVHSTPKFTVGVTRNMGNDRLYYRNDAAMGILNEIDDFLDDQKRDSSQSIRMNGMLYSMTNNEANGKHCTNEGYQQEQQPLQSNTADVRAFTMSKAASTAAVPAASATVATATPAAADMNLISLSEIWGKSGQNTAISCAAPHQSVYIEEQLRRQHLERTVNALQTRLLEYQQRLSVAIEVDRAKDTAICNAQTEAKTFATEVNQLREKVFKLEAENAENNTKVDTLQRELAKAVDLATKFQEKSQKLESELVTSSRKTNECANMYKQKIEELEVEMHGCKRSEEFATNELNKYKDKLVKAEYLNEKLKTRCDDLEKDCATLRQQKETLQEYQQKQKTRADTLEMQKKSLQEKVNTITENETALKRKHELQQKSLKSHYQQQLENVVEQKLKEFQQQMDRNEETLRQEARERERLLADRAVKQIELINEKNEMELNLLQEKQKEEVALYRIQLANAAKKIEDLEAKLSAYKTKRAVIAQKLHSVMEDQWQKALEILTSPSNHSSQHICNTTDCESIANNENENELNKAQAYYETPKKSKTRGAERTLKIKETNLNNANERKSTPEPMDRLQAYIELLLSKSPSEIDKLDEILAMSNKNKSSTPYCKFDKTDKHLNCCKPPWRA